MPTPTGTISMSDVNTELGKSSTAQISLNDTDVRTLAGVSSGAISMDNLRGKSSLTVDYPALASATVSNQQNCASLSVTAGSPTISGGNGTYTYSWTRTSGSSGFNINSTTAQRPTWSRQVCAEVLEEIWQVTVTSGSTSKTDSVTVRLTHNDLR